MSHKVYKSIIDAVRKGKLTEPFSSNDFKSACPGFGKGTYRAFLYKHSYNNPGGNSVLFKRVRPGRFKCLRPFKYGLSIIPYSFRIRFRFPERLAIGIDMERWQITPIGEVPEIVLHSAEKGRAIKDVRQLILRGDGYISETEAQNAGKLFHAALLRAFAHVRIGADFGELSPKGFLTKYGLQMYERELGQRILNDFYGLMTFETEPSPIFVKASARVALTKSRQQFEKALFRAIDNSEGLSEQERLAFDLFNMSFFHQSVDSRFVMLMMAIETLLEPDDRSAKARQHIDELIDLTKSSPKLSRQEKESLLGSLRWLYKESISQTGRKLANSLHGQKYMEKNPAAFFTYCYDLRSKLVHGAVPRPTDKIASIVSILESFVGDLLSGPLLELTSS